MLLLEFSCCDLVSNKKKRKKKQNQEMKIWGRCSAKSFMISWMEEINVPGAHERMPEGATTATGAHCHYKCC